MHDRHNAYSKMNVHGRIHFIEWRRLCIRALKKRCLVFQFFRLVPFTLAKMGDTARICLIGFSIALAGRGSEDTIVHNVR